MTTRFCHGCNAEVEFAEGACLLGHQPRAVTPDSPLADIRSQVDRAFDDARLEVEEALRVEVPVRAGVGADARGTDPDGDLGLTTPRTLGPPLSPPPPPPPPARDPVRSGLSAADPIAQFAPPPRIDWGPERFSLFGLSRLLRSRA